MYLSIHHTHAALQQLPSGRALRLQQLLQKLGTPIRLYNNYCVQTLLI